MARNDWSYSALTMLRRCSRQYYFSQVVASHHFTNPLRRKAFELRQTQNLSMWQGSVIDKIMEKYIMPSISEGEEIDFEKMAQKAVDLAKAQYDFSLNKKYRDKTINKTKAADLYCILDIHESGVSYTQNDIENVYDTVESILNNIPEIYLDEARMPLLDYLQQATFIAANVRNLFFEFEGRKVAPQIDLLAFINGKPVVIDWKVSKNKNSDYSKQLAMIGIAVLSDNRKKANDNEVRKFHATDVTLLEVNLWDGTIKKHEFNQDVISETVDYIFLNSGDEFYMTNGKDFKQINIADIPITDKPSTCSTCKFRNLCNLLLQNNFQYDEAKYNKLVRN
ncbi:MAG TPA: PD-(D/E)XK nuclease family protein [Draconibacterium sp.]|nr:PD-(D/E)XK nuclease family protein [Draconibacterium sp.]